MSWSWLGIKTLGTCKLYLVWNKQMKRHPLYLLKISKCNFVSKQYPSHQCRPLNKTAVYSFSNWFFFVGDIQSWQLAPGLLKTCSEWQPADLHHWWTGVEMQGHRPWKPIGIQIRFRRGQLLGEWTTNFTFNKYFFKTSHGSRVV